MELLKQNKFWISACLMGLIIIYSYVLAPLHQEYQTQLTHEKQLTQHLAAIKNNTQAHKKLATVIAHPHFILLQLLQELTQTYGLKIKNIKWLTTNIKQMTKVNLILTGEINQLAKFIMALDYQKYPLLLGNFSLQQNQLNAEIFFSSVNILMPRAHLRENFSLPTQANYSYSELKIVGVFMSPNKNYALIKYPNAHLSMVSLGDKLGKEQVMVTEILKHKHQYLLKIKFNNQLITIHSTSLR